MPRYANTGAFQIDTNNTINITKSLQHKASGDIVTPPKTDNGIRTITMPEAIMQEIKDYTHKIYGIKPSDRVFTFTKSLIRGNMKRGAEKASIPFIRIHDMRHSHVSLLINMTLTDASGYFSLKESFIFRLL